LLHPSDFFDLSDTAVADLFTECEFVWQAVAKIATHVTQLVGETQTILGQVMAGSFLSDRPIFIGEGARIEPGAYIHGPAYIGAGAVVRHGAFVRENVILMSGAILGHASEAKNSLFLPGAAAPHFNYVGDAILGHRVNLGAGTKLSNLGVLSEKDRVTGKRPSIHLTINGIDYDTGLAKLGAILGDDAQTGCNTVLNPGCLIGRGTLVYANASLRKGYYPARSIIKLRQTIQTAEKLTG
jgi:UDP-N-acetylglucosamine diphosphorylase / glucose-1-phosphate thymidylyltransferase / UDP-N-acetylgalactosamine diphosphorylase / glucosamine-1-phosphate N-acetyltransferase / galactosamine-1-phosphate N-acetyltransferase